MNMTDVISLKSQIARSMSGQLMVVPKKVPQKIDLISFAREMQDKIDAYTPAEVVENIVQDYLKRYSLKLIVTPDPDRYTNPHRRVMAFEEGGPIQGDIELTRVDGLGYDHFVIHDAKPHDDETIQAVDEIAAQFKLYRSSNGSASYTLIDYRDLSKVVEASMQKFSLDIEPQSRERTQKIFYRPVLQIMQTFMRGERLLERDLLYSLVKRAYDANTN